MYNLDLGAIKNVYFIGIGGIGMSALARYFHQKGKLVSGYDKTKTGLTEALQVEGIAIHFEDNVALADKNADLVVYTPAIPQDHQELNWYRAQGKPVLKRSDVLETISNDMFSITIAGTHGKTTVSSMVAHILRETQYGCNAFLGGITVNYNTNFWSSDNNVAVIEADEYDRSFLKLKPNIAVLTSIDADHLDIYGNLEAVEEAFIQYTSHIKPDGTLWYKHGLKKGADFKGDYKCTYSTQNSGADAYAHNITMRNGGYTFNVKGNGWQLHNVKLNLGGMHNVENAVVAMAIAKSLDIHDQAVVDAMECFRGVKRRFEYVVKNKQVVYIDDYAHHPEELATLIKSAKTLFSKRKCVVAFQPHLYSRTRDLAADFARSLDMADEVLLLDIYPAREQPIEGVTSQMIADLMGNPNRTIITKEGLKSYVASAPLDLFITSGAGDIDTLVQPLATEIAKRYGPSEL